MKRIGVVTELVRALDRHCLLIAGVQEYVATAGLDWDVVPLPLPEASRAGRQRQHDGIVGRITPACRDAFPDLPMVNTWIASPARGPGIGDVFIDQAEAAQMAVQHLLAKGVRRFAHVTMDVGTDRARNYHAAIELLRSRGHPCTKILVKPDRAGTPHELWRDFEDQVAALFDNCSDRIGIIAVYETLGRTVASACQSVGVKIPDQAAIVACTGSDMICGGYSPTITAVDARHQRNGFEAAQLLDRLMSGAPCPREPIYTSPGGMVVGQSTDMYYVADDLVAEALRYLEHNLRDVLSTQYLADALDLNRRTLERRFKAAVGRTILQEVNRLRAERLKTLLVQTSSSVEELGREVGFGTYVTTHTVFKAVVGMTPGEYRRIHGVG